MRHTVTQHTPCAFRIPMEHRMFQKTGSVILKKSRGRLSRRTFLTKDTRLVRQIRLLCTTERRRGRVDGKVAKLFACPRTKFRRSSAFQQHLSRGIERCILVGRKQCHISWRVVTNPRSVTTQCHSSTFQPACYNVLHEPKVTRSPYKDSPPCAGNQVFHRIPSSRVTSSRIATMFVPFLSRNLSRTSARLPHLYSGLDGPATQKLHSVWLPEFLEASVFFLISFNPV